MGRAPCCDKANVKKGPWSPEEDAKLKDFIQNYGTAGNWIALPQKAGLKRCGKSCRLRWLNYLRPNIKHGEFSDDEDRIICSLYASIGSRWSIIASQLPGRTDNDIKNYWNTKLKKKILGLIPSNSPTFPFPLQGAGQQPCPQSQSQSLSHLYSSLYGQARRSLPSAAAAAAYTNNNILAPLNFHHSNSNSTHFLANHNEAGLHNYYPIKDNMLVFGGNDAAASCSSSDGSCSQLSYGGAKNHVKQEQIGACSVQGFVENRNAFVLEEPLQRIHGVVENSTQLQYDLDEVKQLITSGGAGNNSLMFGDDNINGGAMGMYYF